MKNISAKETNSGENRKPNNMFDEYDSMGIQMYFNKNDEDYQKKIFTLRSEIKNFIQINLKNYYIIILIPIKKIQ